MSLEINHRWSLTSTGSGARLDGLTVSEWTFYIETGGASTATVFLLSAQSTNSTSVGVIIGSTAGYNLGAGETVIAQFTGPYAAVWPRVSATNGPLTVRGVAVG
jgi:hypothetical protein